MPRATSKAAKRQSEKSKQAQQTIGVMISIMSGSAEGCLKEPKGFMLTNNNQNAKQNKEEPRL